MIAGIAWASPKIYGFQIALRSGASRVALAEIRKELKDNPDDADLHAWAGIAASRSGLFSDAITEFELALGSEVYDVHGISAHANALRVVGRGEEAAALREAQIAIQTREDDESQLWLGMVDDYRYAGDYGSAYDAAWKAISLAPGSGLAYAVLADLELDLGHDEEARYDLWIADRLGGNTVRSHVVRARMSIADGDLELAYLQLNINRLARRNQILGAMQAEILRRQGDANGALGLLSMPRYTDKDQPYMMAEWMACYAQTGDLENARSLRARGLALYPTDPNIAAAAQVVEKAEARAAAKGKP